MVIPQMASTQPWDPSLTLYEREDFEKSQASTKKLQESQSLRAQPAFGILACLNVRNYKQYTRVKGMSTSKIEN